MAKKSFHLNLLSSLILATLHINSFAQTFQWVKQMGGAGWDQGTSIKTDCYNNVYTVGFFEGTVDFDPGIGVFNLTSVGEKDAFICKLDASGNFVWAKQYGDSAAIDEKNSLGIDPLGNLYITNSFLGTVDFDPGAGSFILTSQGMDRNIFVQKLDANGNFIWVKRIGGPFVPAFPTPAHSNAIAVDANGNVYLTGYFDGAIDFDPHPISAFNMTSQLGGSDIFVCKLNTSGNFVWAKQFTGSQGNGGVGYGISLDGNGNIYSTGTIGGSVDFDPGANTFFLSTSVSWQTEVYISKLDSLGKFVWAKAMGPGEGKTIAIDGNNNVYSSGWVPSGYTPVINKLNSSGNLIWAKQLGGYYAVSIALDNTNNVYTTGICWGTNDFDPGSGVFNLTGGNSDSFISKLDSSGNFVWAGLLYGTHQVWVNSLTIDKTSNVYTTGYFNGTTDFDPSSSIFNLTSPAIGYDIFIHKLSANVGMNLAENRFEDDLKIYPNPTNGAFNIAISNINSSELSISIFDIQGKEVYRELDKTITTDYNKQINLSHLSKGMYYIKFNTGTESSIQKLVIQ